ncbi:hypothetical protein DWV78_04715 [Agathobacter rectalis]|uniref:Uncharacterized protein n=1 Tax=Agathobacter rectalis TaxID=39491 RepID=A0A413BID9_9FIRM|nr:hypothetical protein DWV78_04715 [Agathobacter rectalis]
MDTISSLWDILNDINVNNISGVVVISFFIIILFAGCMEPFFASNIEIMLMNRNDILKRTSLSYAILKRTSLSYAIFVHSFCNVELYYCNRNIFFCQHVFGGSSYLQ